MKKISYFMALSLFACPAANAQESFATTSVETHIDMHFDKRMTVNVEQELTFGRFSYSLWGASHFPSYGWEEQDVSVALNNGVYSCQTTDAVGRDASIRAITPAQVGAITIKGETYNTVQIGLSSSNQASPTGLLLTGSQSGQEILVDSLAFKIRDNISEYNTTVYFNDAPLPVALDPSGYAGMCFYGTLRLPDTPMNTAHDTYSGDIIITMSYD